MIARFAGFMLKKWYADGFFLKRINLIIRITELMRINWRADKENQTAGHERDVNFTLGRQILLENKCAIWYNIDTERNVAPRSLVRRSELPASDVTRGCAEISADVSDERSIMAWVCFCDCRKVARLQ